MAGRTGFRCIGCRSVGNAVCVRFIPQKEEPRAFTVSVTQPCAGQKHDFGLIETVAEVTVDSWIFDGKSHTVTVAYNPKHQAPGATTEGCLTVKTEKQDTILQCPMQIHRTMDLERGTKRAWVGLTAGYNDNATREGGMDCDCCAKHIVTRWTFKVNETVAEQAMGDVWGHISLGYIIAPPLDLVATSKSLETYNAIFRWLFLFKRIDHKLTLCRADPKYKILSGALLGLQKDRCELSSVVWTTYQSMSHFLRHLSYYFLVDVLEVQYNLFCKRIDKSNDIEDVIVAHMRYLDAICIQTFVHGAATVANRLRDMLRLCEQFAEAVLNFDTSDDDPQTVKHMMVLANGFHAKAISLYKTLDIYSTTQHTSPYLAQLVLRLNYNDWYSQQYNSDFAQSLYRKM